MHLPNKCVSFGVGRGKPSSQNWIRMAAPRSAMGRIRTTDSLWLQNWKIMGLVDPFTHFSTACGSESSERRVVNSVRPNERRSNAACMKTNLL
jgi:hypothetical protein